MAIEVTVSICGDVLACVSTDATYSPDIAEDLLRRTREATLAVYAALPENDAEPSE